jgi:hypothetical protein
LYFDSNGKTGYERLNKSKAARTKGDENWRFGRFNTVILFILKNKYLYFLFIAISEGCLSNADKIDFFFPESFHGDCVIIYNCKDGITPMKKNDIKQITVPASGIVKLKESIYYGEIKYRYFIADRNKNYIQLKTYESFQVPVSDSFYVGPGTSINEFSIDSNTQKSEKQSAFVFYVHKLGDTLPSNHYNLWIRDTLINQLRINVHYN